MRSIALSGLVVVVALVACGNGSSSVGADAASPDSGGDRCKVSADCTSGRYCSVSPGFCGGATRETCQKDGDCADAGGGTCITDLCANRSCSPTCTSDADCPYTQLGQLVCLTGMCALAPCGATGCPANYVCNGGACHIKHCTADSDCAGACVTGVCSSGLGYCNYAGA
jgi:hypothetical protein